MNEIIEQVYRHQQIKISQAEIARLSARYQKVIMMRLQDKPYRKIARILNITETAARKRYERAKEQLRVLVNSN